MSTTQSKNVNSKKAISGIRVSKLPDTLLKTHYSDRPTILQFIANYYLDTYYNTSTVRVKGGKNVPRIKVVRSETSKAYYLKPTVAEDLYLAARINSYIKDVYKVNSAYKNK